MDQVRKAKALIELNLARDIKGNKKSSIGTLVIKGRLGKMWALSRKKREMRLPRMWRRLRLLLHQSLGAMLPKNLECKGRDWEIEEPPIGGEDQLQDN